MIIEIFLFFFANELSTSKPVAQHKMFNPHKIPQEVIELGHVIDQKTCTQHAQS